MSPILQEERRETAAGPPRLSNVSRPERFFRVVVGIILLMMGFSVEDFPVVRAALYALAAVFLVTAVIRFCPFNAWLERRRLRRRRGPPRVRQAPPSSPA